MEKKSLTIKDIAKMVGASHATVSRVLSGSSYPVSAEMREKIERIARENNYTPNMMGRQLRLPLTNDVGVIVPDFINPYYSAIIASLDECFQDNNLDMLVMRSDTTPEAERETIVRMISRRVRALVLCEDPKDESLIQLIVDHGVRPIVINGASVYPGCTVICRDMAMLGERVVSYLYGLGHRHMAFVRHFGSSSGRYQAAIRAAADKFGVELVDDYPRGLSERGVMSMYKAGQGIAQWLSQNAPQVTAYIASNDMLAVGAIAGLLAQNLSVPGDISVVGRDNVLLARTSVPLLTTVSEDYEGISSAVVDAIYGSGDGGMKLVDADLVVNASTGRVRVK